MALPDTRPLPNLPQTTAAMQHQPTRADSAWDEALLQSQDVAVETTSLAPTAPDKSDTPELPLLFEYRGMTAQMPASFVIVESTQMDVLDLVQVSDIPEPETGADEYILNEGPMILEQGSALPVAGQYLGLEFAIKATPLPRVPNSAATPPLIEGLNIDGPNQALETRTAGQTDLLSRPSVLNVESTARDVSIRDAFQLSAQGGEQTATQATGETPQRRAVADNPPPAVLHVIADAAPPQLREVVLLQSMLAVQPSAVVPTPTLDPPKDALAVTTANNSQSLNKPAPLLGVERTTKISAATEALPDGRLMPMAYAQNQIPTALKVADWQMPPIERADAPPPTLPLKEVMYTATAARPADTAGALGAAIALGWGLRHDLSFIDAANTQSNGAFAEMGPTSPTTSDQTKPAPEVIGQPNIPTGLSPVGIAPISEISISTRLSMTETELDPGRAIGDGLRISGRIEAQTMGPNIPSPVEQAKAALMAHAIAETPGKIDLTLTPEDLGALRFEMKQDAGGLAIVLSAERPETLDLMRRNVADLIAELKEAGLQTGSFTFGAWSDRPPSPETAPPDLADAKADAPPISPHPQALRQTAQVPGGLDLRF